MSEKIIINAVKWREEVYIPLRKLDISIAEKVFGYKFLGWAYCPEEGLIYNPEKYKQDNYPYYQPPLDPVYLKKCECEDLGKICKKYEKEKFFDHYNQCMEIIPCYSSNISDTWLIVNKFTEERYSLSFKFNNGEMYWQVIVANRYNKKIEIVKNNEIIKAICEAALLIFNK